MSASRPMKWDPDQYLAFEDHRLRPAAELLARIPAPSPGLVVDLGCGAGNVTRLLRQRWPDARITGVDNSAEMLDRARATPHADAWVQADISEWDPGEPVDVLYTNAALQWLDGHDTLFPRLAGFVAPGGWLAVQIPANHDSSAHRLVVDTARDGPWRGRLEPVLRERSVGDAGFYYDLLRPDAETLDIWYTEYAQIFTGENPILDFIKGSRLRPLLAALDEPQRSDFEAEFARRVAAAYPKRTDGATLYPFKRLFIVAAIRNA